MANSLHFGLIILIGILTLNINMVTALQRIKTCHASGHMELSKTTTTTTTNQLKNNSNLCQPHKTYPKYHCSPHVKSNTRAIMTLNTFTKRESKGKYSQFPIMENIDHSLDGTRFNIITSVHKNNGSRKGMSKCGKRYYSGKDLVVALSTGWYNGGNRCLKSIRIKGNKKAVVAKVVDECDSVNYGCDSEHGFHVPCGNNIVDASPAVWKALGIPKSEMGNFKITWSDVWY